MRSTKYLLGLVVAKSLTSIALAQTPRLLLQDGSIVVGMGELSTLSYVQVLDSGTWMAQIDTTFPDLMRDGALLRSGFVTLREGSSLFAPPGTTLDEFGSVNLSPDGHLALCLRVQSGGAREALYWNTVPIALQDTPLNSPRVGAGSFWRAFDVCKISGNSEIYVLGNIENTALTGDTPEDALCRFTLDPLGNILTSEVLYTTGQHLEVLETTIEELAESEHALSVNSRGDYLTLVQGTGNINAHLINGTIVIAQEGGPAPVPGRLWRPNGLSNQPRLWLNEKGEYLFSGVLEGTTGNYLVVKNGTTFARSGEVYPSFSSSPLTNGLIAPLILTDNGDVFWRADSSAGSDDAFLRNFTPILQANRTVVDGDLVIAVKQTENAFSVSPNGRYFVGRVDLQAGGEAALFVDLGRVEERPGCAGNTATLKVTDGLALPGSQMTFSMDLAQVEGALPILFLSTQASVPGSDCGVRTAFGELLIANAHRIGRAILPIWNQEPSSISLAVPPEVSLVDQIFHAQGVFRDLNGSNAPAFALTNGLELEFGAP